jgi:hypothetical protein
MNHFLRDVKELGFVGVQVRNNPAALHIKAR